MPDDLAGIVVELWSCGAVAVWQCDHCGATGMADVRAGGDFANEEVEHALMGCNGSLRFLRWARPCGEPPAGLPPIPCRVVFG